MAMGSWSWCCIPVPMLFAILLLLVEAVTSTGGGPVKECDARISKCEARMARGRMRPVCGSNNQTYSSRCALLRAHCLLGDVTLKHRGRCRERQPCWARQSKDDGAACLPDGRFAPVQCHRATGYCWCVTPRGRPIPNTSRRNRKPKCKKRAKTRRGSESRGRKQNKECTRVDRSAFVNNIVRIFSTEYQRAVTGEEEEDEVLEWKFNSLDLDHNGWLNRDEYAELRRLVRKVVRPKRCARSFARHCDLDRDMRITRQEWTSCLSLHLNPDSEDELTDMEGEDGFGVLQENSASLMEGGAGGAGAGGAGTGGAGGGGGMHSLLGEEVDHREEPEANNCLTDQKTALDEQKLVSLEMYVPECTPDGRYRKVQCYKSTGYCWCVQEDSGKPIPGTSVKDLHPKCDAIPTPSRPMKGCPEYKKQVFLKDLMEFLMHTMATIQKGNANDTSTIPPNDLLDEDQIATWNFIKLDTNKNKVLERKEWKSFRGMISPNRKLRQCGRKLPRYCDVNNDRKVSMTEWINCLNATKTKVVNVTADVVISSTASPRRRGINPLDRYLKED